MQNSAKMAPSTSSTSIRPVSAAKMVGGDAKLLGLELRTERLVAVALKRGLRGLKLDPVAGAGQKRRPRPRSRSESRLLGERLDKVPDPLARSWPKL